MSNDHASENWQSIDRLSRELDTGGSQLRPNERYLLYSLVRGLQPRTALEIGSAEGGSAQLICAAMDAAGLGRLICVDPEFRFADAVWGRVSHRVTRVDGATPRIMPEVVRALAGDPVDFAFIDGDHTYTGASDDIACVMPLLASGAVMLFHDSHHPPVRAAIDAALSMHADRLTDIGQLSAEISRVPSAGGEVLWGGLRALRFEPRDTGRVGGQMSERDSGGLIRELSEECSRLRQESKAIAAGFEDRGRRVIELEGEVRRVWEESAKIAQGFEQRGRHVAELEQELRRVAACLRDAVQFGQDRERRISELELRQDRG